MMNMLFFTYACNSLLMVALGIGLGLFLTRKFTLGWRLWWIGAATFILSQVGHIPFNLLLSRFMQSGILPTPPEAWLLYFNAIILGISSGIWEETARYIMYRWIAKDARAWQKAFLTGAGHGGIEAIILGILALIAFIQMAAYQNVDLNAIVPADQLDVAQMQIQAYWSAPWYATLLGAMERVFALCLHIANSVMVLQVFIRKQSRWLWAAIGWHALFNAGALIANTTWGVYVTEGVLGIGAIISLAIIFKLRQPKGSEKPERPEAPLSPIEIQQVEEGNEDLNRSRFFNK